jgi:hypothetical protein
LQSELAEFKPWGISPQMDSYKWDIFDILGTFFCQNDFIISIKK